MLKKYIYLAIALIFVLMSFASCDISDVIKITTSPSDSEMSSDAMDSGDVPSDEVSSKSEESESKDTEIEESSDNVTNEDTTTGVLVQPEEPKFNFTQESVVASNEYTSKDYTSFNKDASPEILVPGLNQLFIPQGMDIWEEKGLLIISGYFKDTTYSQSSVVFAVELESGKLAGEYYIMNADSSAYTGHAGGIAVTPHNLYISEGACLHRIPLSSVIQAGHSGNISIVESVKVPVRASFCNYSDGVLWVGDFYYGTSYPTDEYRHMTNRDGKQYCAWSVGYYLADSEGEFTSDKWNPSLQYATPDIIFSIDQKIQGFSVIGETVALSQSYGRTNNSKIYIYKNVSKTEKAHTEVSLNGKSVPVWFLDSRALKSSYTALPMSEGIDVYNGELYILFESGASYYKDNGGKNPTDRVWKLKVK